MFILVLAFLGLITMWLWNWLIPDLFHGPTLDYLHAVGLLVLSRVLVGIRGGRRGWRPWKWGKNWKHQWGNTNAGPNWGGNWGHKHHWKHGNQNEYDCGEWWQKFAGMSPDERQRVKDEWKSDKAKWKAEFKRHFDNPQDGPSEGQTHN